MVKHIILWTLDQKLSEIQKEEVKKGIKEGLESLCGVVPGLLDVKVIIDGRLSSSNCDVMLDSTLESEEALKGYPSSTCKGGRHKGAAIYHWPNMSRL